MLYIANYIKENMWWNCNITVHIEKNMWWDCNITVHIEEKRCDETAI